MTYTTRAGFCLGILLVVLVPAALGGALLAAEPQHKFVTPDAVEWSDNPPAALPPGAKVAILYGDPSKEGLFAMRLKFPKGYFVPPHTHPKPEIVTVISGTLLLGMGASADREKTDRLPAGSFISIPPEMQHYGYTEEETVVQMNSVGPWQVNYVNPADDPRNKNR